MIFRKITYISVLLVSFVLLAGSAVAQYENTTSEIESEETMAKIKPMVSVGVMAGFTSFGPGYNSFSTTIAPRISFPVSDRFSVSTGVGYTSLFMNQPSLFSGGPSSYGHLFVSGDYLLNEKVKIRGTAYTTFNLTQSPPPESTNSPYYDFSSKGFAVDVEYKVTERFRINVGVEYRDQNYPYYPNGFGTPLNGINGGGHMLNFHSPHNVNF